MAQDPSQAARVRKLLIAGTITAKPAMTATPAAPAHNTEIGPTAPPAVRPVSKVKPVIRPQSSLPLVRHAGGQQWVDPTLKDFPASTWCDGDDDDDETDDFRLFVGDLGPECTDQMMVDAFRKYSSFLYARAVRDKKELSCKGYGFVSFADVNDYVKAYREMNGKYIGSRPCRLRKSNWKERNDTIGQKKFERDLKEIGEQGEYKRSAPGGGDATRKRRATDSGAAPVGTGL